MTVNLFSDNPTKWSDTLKQFVGSFPTNCSCVFEHFVGLALKGLNLKSNERQDHSKRSISYIVLVTEIQFCMTYPSGTLPPYLLLLKIEKKIWLTKYGQMGLELSKVFRNQSFPKISSFFLPCSKSIVVTKSNRGC